MMNSLQIDLEANNSSDKFNPNSIAFTHLHTSNSKRASGSRITLANPDPSAGENEDYIIRAKRSTVFSESDSVTFLPDQVNNNNKNEDGGDSDADNGQTVVGTVESVTLNIREHIDTDTDNVIEVKDEL